MIDVISLALGAAKLTGLDEKIGRWIGGDNGASVAEKVVDVARVVTGTTDPEEAIKQLKADEKKQFEFEKQLAAQEFELERLAYQDRADARSMQEAALLSDDTFSKRFVYYFAIGWSLFACLYMGLATFLGIPEASVRFADTILGFLLGTVLAGMFGYFYGSSDGNEKRADKDSRYLLPRPET